MAAVWLAPSAAPLRVFAPIAASVVGASALAADSLPQQPSLAPAVGGPAPASAGAAVAPDPASRVPFPAVAGISGPPAAFLYLE